MSINRFDADAVRRPRRFAVLFMVRAANPVRWAKDRQTTIGK